MNLIGRILAGSVVAILALFLLTGLFDYFYFRSVIGTFEQGLGEINWVNAHLGKAVIAAFSALTTFVFFKYEATSLSVVSNRMGRFIISSFIITALFHTILTFATWGNIFNSVGHSGLYYGIDDSNEVRYFNRGGAHPQTGEPLIAVTPENVREVEIRRHAKFSEITDPANDMWFAPGSGKPMLWYSEREDGFHFFKLPGFDPATSRKLEPVTVELQPRYFAAKKARPISPSVINRTNEASPSTPQPSLANNHGTAGGTTNKTPPAVTQKTFDPNRISKNITVHPDRWTPTEDITGHHWDLNNVEDRVLIRGNGNPQKIYLVHEERDNQGGLVYTHYRVDERGKKLEKIDGIPNTVYELEFKALKEDVTIRLEISQLQ